MASVPKTNLLQDALHATMDLLPFHSYPISILWEILPTNLSSSGDVMMKCSFKPRSSDYREIPLPWHLMFAVQIEGDWPKDMIAHINIPLEHSGKLIRTSIVPLC